MGAARSASPTGDGTTGGSRRIDQMLSLLSLRTLARQRRERFRTARLTSAASDAEGTGHRAVGETLPPLPSSRTDFVTGDEPGYRPTKASSVARHTTSSPAG